MNLEAEILDIKRTQARIDGKLTALLNKPEKKTWVPVSFVTDLTGWDGEKLRQVREAKIIEFRHRKDCGGYEYLLESIPEQFIKKTA